MSAKLITIICFIIYLGFHFSVGIYYIIKNKNGIIRKKKN
jgi:succinate dehydrogenase/fumarate reductase cytochrome b subunit